MSKVLPSSHSMLESYETCPYRHWKLKILKEFKEPPQDHLIWGNEVHKALELRAKFGTPVPSTMTRFQPITDKIVAAKGETLAECEWAITVDLKPTGWWSNDAWYRGKVDIAKIGATRAFNGDYKTGKVKENSIQMERMGMLTLIYKPEIIEVDTAFLWISTRPDKPTFGKVVRADIPRIVQGIQNGVQDMLWSEQHGTWPKNPSGLCKKHCPVRDCEFYGVGRS